MSEEKWGFGNPENARPFGVAILGSADKGCEVELLFGESPHTRSDNQIYAKFSDGHVEEFDGHRILIDVSIKCNNYMKESHYSGDQIRKGGSCVISADGIAVFEFFFRDPQWALLRAHRLIEELGEHSSHWLSKSARNELVGRKVYYDRTPAIVKRLVEDQGCVILEPDGVDRFPSPVWRDADDDWGDDYEFSLKVEVLDPKIWWHRKDSQ